MKQQYSAYSETIDFLNQAMAEHPHLIRARSIGTTGQNRAIMMATISLDVAWADHKPALLYTGSIHAREWIGNELAVKFIQYIIDNYRLDPKLLAVLTTNTLYIVPCLNPDGFEYSRLHFSFWRKNRRDNGDGHFGVDLNRNFGVRFKKQSDVSSVTYGGAEAFSEPETRAMKHFVEQHPNISIALDYHSQGNVFFPAHKFNHEKEIEGTDLNVLCANMNRAIKKISGREYGIHRGKPPFNLIHGSGREYYYSKGILAIVVEVGTRNIPDYMQDMAQSIDENIPALLYAFSEVGNYAKHAPKRPENFNIFAIGVDKVTLTWQYSEHQHVYFEIYRSDQSKSACCEETLVGITRSLSFTDIQLKSGQQYFYYLRAVEPIHQVKSPFSPELKLLTLLNSDEFSRALFPTRQDIGYVGELALDKNKEHFANNSLFIGVSKKRGICYGVIAFSLDTLPANITLKSARLSLYPMNRVAAKIEKYGEWSISILAANDISDLTDFDQIHQAKPLHTLGQTIESDKLSQGIWREWTFNGIERKLVESLINGGQILLRIQGPTSLPLGQDSQIMQFDIGYGRFGGGIHYRPNLELIYTKESTQLTLKPADLNTISLAQIKQGSLQSGFDLAGNIVYGQMAFTLEQLPRPEKTVITQAYLIMQNKNSLNTNKDIRFTIELAELKDIDYNHVKQRQKIEFIGYEVSNAQLKEKNSHHFIFDSYCRQELERLHSENKAFYFILRATAISNEKNALIDWHSQHDKQVARLVIEYTEHNKQAPPPPTHLQAFVEKRGEKLLDKSACLHDENTQVKLIWTNPKNDEFVGSYVVRNSFHPAKSPFDGVKLYAGKDEYTYDNFGNANLPKYYSVFSYDDVPNYSLASSLYYKNNEMITIEAPSDEDYDSLLDEYGLLDTDKD
jgi:carboxypeptidase T